MKLIPKQSFGVSSSQYMFKKKHELKEVKEYSKLFSEVRNEISKVVVGQEKVIDGLLMALVSRGHVIVEGVPGIAKTLVIMTLASTTGCKFSRIQFTVDLLPTDIVGITTYDKNKGFATVKGPIFSNFVIADEINRAGPRTQAALLEAMQEGKVTIGKNTYELEKPFFVMATQNPIESEGVFRLPEAQIDRFLFKLNMIYPERHEEKAILNQNITLKDFDDYILKKILSPKKIIEIQNFVHKIYLSKDIEDYIVSIVKASREKNKLKSGKYIEYGASPRASIGLFIASKADALLRGNSYVTPQNVKNVAYEVLRHRILLNYEGQAENVKTDDITKEILATVPIP